MHGLIQQAQSVSLEYLLLKLTCSCWLQAVTVYLGNVALTSPASEMPGHKQVAGEAAAKVGTMEVVSMVRSCLVSMLTAVDITPLIWLYYVRTPTIRRTSQKTVQLHPSHSATLSPHGVLRKATRGNSQTRLSTQVHS